MFSDTLPVMKPRLDCVDDADFPDDSFIQSARSFASDGTETHSYSTSATEAGAIDHIERDIFSSRYDNIVHHVPDDDVSKPMISPLPIQSIPAEQKAGGENTNLSTLLSVSTEPISSVVISSASNDRKIVSVSGFRKDSDDSCRNVHSATTEMDYRPEVDALTCCDPLAEATSFVADVDARNLSDDHGTDENRIEHSPKGTTDTASSESVSGTPFSVVGVDAIRSRWIETLASPVTATAFAPTLSQSKFGWAVSSLLSRISDITQVEKRTIVLLQSVATLYETTASVLQTAALNVLLPTRTLNTPASSLNHPFKKILSSLHDWGIQYSRDLHSHCQSIRSICLPTQAYLIVLQEAGKGVMQRLHQAKSRCREAKMQVPSSSDSCERQDLIRIENQWVHKCHRLEEMALEQVLLAEINRVDFIGATFHKYLTSTHAFLGGMVTPCKSDFRDLIKEEETDDYIGSKASENQRAKKKIFTKKGPSEPLNGSGAAGGGLMDAESLGLPDDVGCLRDKVKWKIAVGTNRLQVVRALAVYLDNVIDAFAKLSEGLRLSLEELRLPSSRSPSRSKFTVSVMPPSRSLSFKSLEMAMEDEAPGLSVVWKKIFTLLECEVKSAIALVNSIRALSDSLQRINVHSDKSIKIDAETDDRLWRQLCEAARHHLRTETKYRQVSAQTAKMRERVMSVDSDPGSNRTKKELSKVNKHVSKGIANMFSILPDGGAEALKIFTPGARATIAAQSLEEADTRETNRRQQLDAAAEETARCLALYRTSAESLANQYDKNDTLTWDNICIIVDRFADEISTNTSVRLHGLGAVYSPVRDFSYLEELGELLQDKMKLKMRQNHFERTEERVTRTDCTGLILDYGETESSIQSELILRPKKVERVESLSTSNAVEAINDNVTSNNSMLQNHSFSFDIDTDERVDESPQKSVSSTDCENLSVLPSKLDALATPASMLTLETEIFISCFWQETVERSKIPTILESFACSFRDRSERLPKQYGRLFITSSRIIFSSWTGRKLDIKLIDVMDIALIEDRIGDSMNLTTRKNGSEILYSTLGGFNCRQYVIDKIHNLQLEAIRNNASSPNVNESIAEKTTSLPSVEALPPVPPDATLTKMTVVLSQRLKSVSIHRFYEIVWAEEGAPLYEPWLSRACFDVDVGRWKVGSVTGPWCGEKYDQTRMVTFKVKRKTHLYIGPPIANVKQTHFCRRVGDDTCILAMTIEFEGMPYCETFSVEVRWVARREGSDDTQIDVGVFVHFRKNTILKSKIQAGTLEETAPVQKNLFEYIKTVCYATEDQAAEATEDMIDSVDDEDALKTNATDVKKSISIKYPMFVGCMVLLIAVLFLPWSLYVGFPHPRSPVVVSSTTDDIVYLVRRIHDLETEIRAVHNTLFEVIALLKDHEITREIIHEQVSS